MMDNKSGIQRISNKCIYILLCNENGHLMEAYRNLIIYLAEKHGYLVQFMIYENGREAVFCEEDQMRVLDIVMIGWEFNAIPGIKIAQLFRKNDCDAEIIFMGSHNGNILDSFRVNPFYYFVESEMSHGKFEEILIKCFEQISIKKNNSICFIRNGKMCKIALSKIIYLRVEHRVTRICCLNGQELSFYESLKNVEESIQNDKFVRIHRGYIINLDYVDSVDKGELSLLTGEKLPIARNYKQELIERIMQQEKMIIL